MNPLVNLAGHYSSCKKPKDKDIIENILNGLSLFSGTCWNPCSIDGGYSLMFNQCPGACGHVWYINIKDKEVSNWIVSEVNKRRHKKNEE